MIASLGLPACTHDASPAADEHPVSSPGAAGQSLVAGGSAWAFGGMYQIDDCNANAPNCPAASRDINSRPNPLANNRYGCPGDYTITTASGEQLTQSFAAYRIGRVKGPEGPQWGVSQYVCLGPLLGGERYPDGLGWNGIYQRDDCGVDDVPNPWFERDNANPYLRQLDYACAANPDGSGTTGYFPGTPYGRVIAPDSSCGAAQYTCGGGGYPIGGMFQRSDRTRSNNIPNPVTGSDSCPFGYHEVEYGRVREAEPPVGPAIQYVCIPGGTPAIAINREIVRHPDGSWQHAYQPEGPGAGGWYETVDYFWLTGSVDRADMIPFFECKGANGHSLFTADPTCDGTGFTVAPTLGYISRSARPGTTPLFRIQLANEVFLTTSRDERNALIANGTGLDAGIAGWVFTSIPPQPTTMTGPLQRGVVNVAQFVDRSTGKHSYGTEPPPNGATRYSWGLNDRYHFGAASFTSGEQSPQAGLMPLFQCGTSLFLDASCGRDPASKGNDTAIGYVAETPGPGTTPLYHLRSSLPPILVTILDDFYTTSRDERDQKLAAGYLDMGIQGFVWAPPGRAAALEGADSDADGIPDTVEAKLLANHTPYLKFSTDNGYMASWRDEEFKPESVLDYAYSSNVVFGPSGVDRDSQALGGILTSQYQATSGLVFSNILYSPCISQVSPCSNNIGGDWHPEERRSFRLVPYDNAVYGGVTPWLDANGKGSPGTLMGDRNVGLYGHVVPVRITDEKFPTWLPTDLPGCTIPSGDFARYLECAHLTNDMPGGRLYYKVEYWQYFGKNSTNAILGAADHDGDWVTVQLLIDPGDDLQGDTVAAVFHYAHGGEMGFHFVPVAGVHGAYQTSNVCHPTSLDGFPFTECRGASYPYRVHLPDTAGTQDNLVRFFGPGLAHPIAYLENGTHEIWPTNDWDYTAPNAPPHNGFSRYGYLAAPPLNVGEVEAPMGNGIDLTEARVVTQYDGFWGSNHGINGNSPPGPNLHAQWTYPPGSKVAPYTQQIAEP